MHLWRNWSRRSPSHQPFPRDSSWGSWYHTLCLSIWGSLVKKANYTCFWKKKKYWEKFFNRSLHSYTSFSRITFQECFYFKKCLRDNVSLWVREQILFPLARIIKIMCLFWGKFGLVFGRHQIVCKGCFSHFHSTKTYASKKHCIVQNHAIKATELMENGVRCTVLKTAINVSLTTTTK